MTSVLLLSLHDALPISTNRAQRDTGRPTGEVAHVGADRSHARAAIAHLGVYVVASILLQVADRAVRSDEHTPQHHRPTVVVCRRAIADVGADVAHRISA